MNKSINRLVSYKTASGLKDESTATPAKHPEVEKPIKIIALSITGRLIRYKIKRLIEVCLF